MFEATRILFVYVETPLHVGSGRGMGAVDLPIQRERATGYPMVQASSLKGRLRAEAKGELLPEANHLAIFGPESGNASEYAGALSTGDARILLFPVRSLAGVFAWVTCVDVLARFGRTAAMARVKLDWPLISEPAVNSTLVSGDVLNAGDSVVLEEFSFAPDKSQADELGKIAGWLANNALPQTPEYDYWRKALPDKLCILPENAFRDFVTYGTEVQTHVKLDPDTKTVQTGALWTAESLPVDTLMYAPLMATQSRAAKVTLSADGVMKSIADLNLGRTQLGGDETTGQGVVALKMVGGAQ